MKPNEMKLGRWYHNKVIDVDYILDNYIQIGDAANYESISFSEQILLDNGFFEVRDSKQSKKYDNPVCGLKAYMLKPKQEFYISVGGKGSFKVETVDEFQAILEACKLSGYSEMLKVN